MNTCIASAKRPRRTARFVENKRSCIFAPVVPKEPGLTFAPTVAFAPEVTTGRRPAIGGPGRPRAASESPRAAGQKTPRNHWAWNRVGRGVRTRQYRTSASTAHGRPGRSPAGTAGLDRAGGAVCRVSATAAAARSGPASRSLVAIWARVYIVVRRLCRRLCRQFGVACAGDPFGNSRCWRRGEPVRWCASRAACGQSFLQLPGGVIGNTRDFGSLILGSSPSRVAGGADFGRVPCPASAVGRFCPFVPFHRGYGN